MNYLATTVLMLAVTPALAQSNEITSFIIAGGGASGQTIGVLSLSGTIGQADASAPLMSGNLTLVGGFWSTVIPPQSCIADLNNDGVLNFFDVSTFLVSFSEGCP